jgi:Tol biopolymer transport system component
MRRPFFRQVFLISLGSLFAACGSGTSGKTTDTHPGAPAPIAETGSGVIVSRTAPVPPASNAAERIVCVRGGSVWMMGVDGQDPEQLTVRSLEAPDMGPRISPDGRLLVYSSAKDGVQKLYLQSMEDMIPNAISAGSDHAPAWSPDGSMLAFMRGDERVSRDLYLLHIDAESGLPNGDPKLLLQGDDDHPERTGDPVWDADGKSILISADRREHLGTSIWRVPLRGGAPQRVTPVRNAAPWTSDRWASLSPDGRRMAFASNRHASTSDSADDYDVYTIKMDGSGLTRLSEDPGTVAGPVYSHDGSRLYFASTRLRTSGYEWEIFVMASGGGEQQRVTREARPENYSPSMTILPSPAK